MSRVRARPEQGEQEENVPSKSKSTLPDLLYVGIKGSVVALQKSDGKIAWSV